VEEMPLAFVGSVNLGTGNFLVKNSKQGIRSKGFVGVSEFKCKTKPASSRLVSPLAVTSLLLMHFSLNAFNVVVVSGLLGFLRIISRSNKWVCHKLAIDWD